MSGSGLLMAVIHTWTDWRFIHINARLTETESCDYGGKFFLVPPSQIGLKLEMSPTHLILKLFPLNFHKSWSSITAFWSLTYWMLDISYWKDYITRLLLDKIIYMKNLGPMTCFWGAGASCTPNFLHKFNIGKIWLYGTKQLSRCAESGLKGSRVNQI